MSNPNVKNKVKADINKPKVISKSRQDFKNELLNFAKANFENQISDFSEMSLGGMFLDFAAIVGESLTYYVDQQMNELDYENATSDYNIVNHLRKANIKSNFSSPSSASVDFYITVTANSTDNMPDISTLPVIKKGTKLLSEEGVPFILEEDVDFNKGYNIFQTILDSNNDPSEYFIFKSGICTSGQISSESITFPETVSNDFLSYTLSNNTVTKIIKVVDNSIKSNEYKEVEFLSQDVIYEKIETVKEDFFEIRPAPFRFVVENNFDTGLTTLRFGNGNGKILEDGMFTNPEDIALPLLGRDYSNNFSLDPKSLLNSDSLGVSPAGKTITISYKHGGGEDHNVSAETITQITELIITFPNSDEDTDDISKETVIASVSVINMEPSLGGSNPLTLEELREFIPLSLKQQSRIVTHEDLLARIYTMPSNFGRIHKATIINNPYTKISKDMYVICKDNNGNYIAPNDAIKSNLSKFINEHRLIGDSFNIIDSPIYNFGVFLKIKIHESFNPRDVVINVKNNIFNKMRFETLQIGQGINVNDIIFSALNTSGVLTVSSNYKSIIRSKSTEDFSPEGIVYSENKFSSYESYEDGIVYPPRGGIFELKDSSDIQVINN